jgi:hypothetical protein
MTMATTKKPAKKVSMKDLKPAKGGTVKGGRIYLK